jgi:hypothetical protein
MSSVIAMKEIEKVMEAYAKSYAETQIEILCGHYDLDLNEAMGLMKKKRRKTKELKKPIVEANVEPNVEPIVEPIVEANVEPIVEPIVEANVEPIVEPIVEANVEPNVEANVEANVEPIVEANVEPNVEANVEPNVEAIVEPNVEPIVEANVEAKKKEAKAKKETKAKAKKETKLEMEIELPFSGEIDEERCQGIRTAGKLYTQCLTYREEGVRYCKKCQKESEKNESGKPNNGDMEERKKVGLYEFKDKDGKNPWLYYKLMKKHGWSREYVEEIGAKYGIKISEEHYNEEEMNKPVHQKGKMKGRPKKEEKKVEVVEEEIAVVEEPELEIEEVIVEEEEPELEIEEEIVEEEEEEEGEEEVVEEIEEEGERYLRSRRSGIIYSAEDMENPKVVGIWDRVREKIDFNYEESSDEEE